MVMNRCRDQKLGLDSCPAPALYTNRLECRFTDKIPSLQKWDSICNTKHKREEVKHRYRVQRGMGSAGFCIEECKWDRTVSTGCHLQIFHLCNLHDALDTDVSCSV